MPRFATSAQGLRLSDVIARGSWIFCDQEPRIQACTHRLDQCEPGDLFVVLDDDLLVDQDAIDAAITAGATAMMSERPIPCSLPQYIVDDCRIALGQLCQALAGTPCQSLRTIGITGTYGKTSVEQLLRGVFRAARWSADGLSSTSIETHGAPFLAHWLAESRAAGQQAVAIEASSQTLSRHLLEGVQLDAAVITNIRREHADLHGTLANYQHAKARIVNYLKAGGFAVINADDPACQQLLPSLDMPVMTFGMRQSAEVMATLLERFAYEQTFLIEAGDESIVVRTPIIGDGHIANCLAAAAVGLTLGLELPTIVRGLEMVQEIAGCLQRIECGQPFTVFVDHSHSPHAVANLLKTARQVTSGNLTCLMGIDHRQSDHQCAQLGRTLERYADKAILTGAALDKPMSLHAAHDVLDGYDRPAQAHLMPDRARAICWALAQAQPGDVIVFAGAKPPAITESDPLTDADVTRYWLQHVEQGTPCPWLPV